jgi:acyl-CoA synthetase (AMP-forming)/AMP-acid ligase II
VVGLPDERYGEVVAAYIVCHKDSKISAKEVRHWVRERLSHHLGMSISLGRGS